MDADNFGSGISTRDIDWLNDDELKALRDYVNSTFIKRGLRDEPNKNSRAIPVKVD